MNKLFATIITKNTTYNKKEEIMITLVVDWNKIFDYILLILSHAFYF